MYGTQNFMKLWCKIFWHKLRPHRMRAENDPCVVAYGKHCTRCHTMILEGIDIDVAGGIQHALQGELLETVEKAASKEFDKNYN